MREYVKELITASSVCALALSLSPSGKSGTFRVIRMISALLIALTVLSPLSSFSEDAAAFFEGNGATAEEFAAIPQFDDAVIERTAAVISDHVIRTLADKYGIADGVRVSVIVDDSDKNSVRLSEIRIFCSARIDSYRDREIEERLSLDLGCSVYIFSE